MVEAKETKKSQFPYQNRAKANGISPNLYHSGRSPKLSHTPLQFGRKCQSVSIRRQLDAMFKRQAYSWDRGYDKEHGGDVISFLTHVCAIWWLDGVCLCLHLYVCVCVCVEKKMTSFFMVVQRLFDVPVAALAVPGPRLGNSEWQRGKW